MTSRAISAFFLLIVAAAAQATVRGRVVRADNGNPYIGVQVVLSHGDQHSPPAYTGNDGMFFLQNVPPGSYAIELRSKQDRRVLRLEVSAAPYTDLPSQTMR